MTVESYPNVAVVQEVGDIRMEAVVVSASGDNIEIAQSLGCGEEDAVYVPLIQARIFADMITRIANKMEANDRLLNKIDSTKKQP